MASTAYLLNSGAQAIPRGPNELAETVRRRVRGLFAAVFASQAWGPSDSARLEQ